MKKIYFILLAAVLAGVILSGCSKNEGPAGNNVGERTYTNVTFKAGHGEHIPTAFGKEASEATRIHYNPTTNFYGWDEGDEVGISVIKYTGAEILVTNKKLTTVPESGTFPDATVELHGYFDLTLTNEVRYDYVFMYPYTTDIVINSETLAVSNYAQSGNITYIMDIPTNFDVVGGVVKGIPYFASMSGSDGFLPSDFNMTTPYSLLHIPLKMGTGMTGDYVVNEIEISTTDNEPIGGKLYVTHGATGTTFTKAPAGGETKWTFKYGNGITINTGTVRDFYMALPRPLGSSAIFEAGLTFVFKTDRGDFTKKTIDGLFVRATSKSTLSTTPLALTLDIEGNGFAEITPGQNHSEDPDFWN